MAGKVNVEVADNGDLLVSVGVLCDLPIVKVSKAAVGKWVKAGLPFKMAGKRKLFPISSTITWMIEQGKIEIEVSDIADLGRSKLPPDLRDKLASAELKEFRLKREQGEVIEREEVERQSFEISKKTQEALYSIPTRRAEHLLNAKSAHEIAQILEDEITKVIEDLKKDIDAV